ncbi:MAG: HEAT repeat domain-containing protein [Vicinamibacteria bacterium]
MRRAMLDLRPVALCLSLLATAPPAAAQPASLTNATVVPHAATGGLAPMLAEVLRGVRGTEWVGWSAPATADAEMCCWNSWSDSRGGCCHGCRLGGRRETRGADATEHAPAPPDEADGMAKPAPVRLGGAERLLVLLRAEAGAVRRVETYTEGCPIDAGGATLHWIDGASSADSVAALSKLVRADASERSAKRLADAALASIAHHAGDAADAALASFLAAEQPLSVRKKAAFWVGNARQGRGLDTLLRLAREDRDAAFREHLAFVLTQAKDERATDALVRMAKQDESPRVRGQALFWLGQQASRKAVAAIAGAIESDPETEIKKKAVFALSQLPRDEGVPLLIKTARGHSNPAVRKQAMFWLGQSQDARALAFFEEVLLKN